MLERDPTAVAAVAQSAVAFGYRLMPMDDGLPMDR